MLETATGELAGQRFRRPPGTVVEPFRGLDDKRGSEGFFGIVAVPGRSEPRLVDADTALLLLAMEDPGPLPTFAASDLLRHGGRDLIALIAENLVEVYINDSFVTGTHAVRSLLAVAAPVSRTSRLNRSVMRTRYGWLERAPPDSATRCISQTASLSLLHGGALSNLASSLGWIFNTQYQTRGR